MLELANGIWYNPENGDAYTSKVQVNTGNSFTTFYNGEKKPILGVSSSGYILVHLENKVSKNLHRLVGEVLLGAKDGDIVDHINRDKSDNRLSNLRVTTQSENCKNCGPNSDKLGGVKFKGVSYRPKKNKYTAQIKIDGKCKYIGIFDTDLEAAYAYDAVAKANGYLTNESLGLFDK